MTEGGDGTRDRRGREDIVDGGESRGSGEGRGGWGGEASVEEGEGTGR